MYTRVSAGKDYYLTGLKLMVRNADQPKKSAVVNYDKLQHEKDRNIHPEHANVDKNSLVQDRLKKSVITSYSIHYTKLYDPSLAGRPLRRTD